MDQTRNLEIDPVRFELSNIDRLAFDLARREGVLGKEKNVIEYSKVKSSDALWDEVMESVLTDRDKSFLMTEYRDIILYHHIKDKQAYFSILRPGRGEALSRRKRNELWKILEVYNEVKDKSNLVDRDELYNLLSDHFQEKSEKLFHM